MSLTGRPDFRQGSAEAAPQSPLISLIVPMWNVERYLPDFLASLSIQGDALNNTEVIFVDDGSPDECRNLAQTWLLNSGATGKVLSQSNSGTAAARNTGLQHATGNWVSFPDPDDVLPDAYLDVISGLMALHEFAEATMIAANMVYLNEESGELRDNHPLKYCFGNDPELVDLSKQPERIKFATNSSFYRRSIINAAELKFDPRIVPTGEDSVFTMRYHLQFASPKVLFVPQAKYFYRKRMTKDSLMDLRFSAVENYSVRPKLQWIAPLEYAQAKLGEIPRWLEFMVLYTMQWYFAADQRLVSAHKKFYGPVLDEFLDDTKHALSLMSPDSINEFDVVRISRQTRAALLALTNSPAHQNQIQIGDIDPVKREIQLRYFFTGDQLTEIFLADGKLVLPRYEKTRAIDYFGHRILFERILWLPNDKSLTATLNGAPATIDRFPEVLGPRKPPLGQQAQKRPALAKISRVPIQVRNVLTGRSNRVKQLRSRILMKFASSLLVKRKYSGAWVFFDARYRAQDNAEHLYRWVQKHHPEINLFFVISRGTKDWHRLSSAGFRMIALKSFSHKALQRHASTVISSHIPPNWMRQIDGKNQPPFKKFIYLGHGVTKDDMSRSHNSLNNVLYLTSAQGEYDSVTADFTNYKFTPKESILTGMPRHDELLRKNSQYLSKDKKLITVMPTWRAYLNNPRSRSQKTKMTTDEFLKTSFSKAWMNFLSDPILHAAAAKKDLQIVLLPHSNIADFFSAVDLHPNVTSLRPVDVDIQEILAQTAIAITDYSSIVMDSAFINTPVIYYQFDSDEFFSKQGHRPGFFNYENDGFGPVCKDSQEAVAAAIPLIENPEAFATEYRARARSFFKFRDGMNCERTYQAIVEALTPISD